MRRVCRLAVTAGFMAALVSCGSTNDDALVLSFQGFSDMGLTQCDQVNPEVADIDLIQDLCMGGTGGEGTPEPFTETSATASFQNNQKLDITLNQYVVNFQGTGAPTVTINTSQTITGKRCSNDDTRGCAVDSDCVILGGGVGICEPSISEVQILLASFTTKNFLLPDIGNTVTASVQFFGSDVTGASWTAQATIAATLEDFNNCTCSLSQ